MQSLKDPIKDSIVGHYALQTVLSRKAGRQTFVAKDLETQMAVTVKILQFGGALQWNDLKLFKREAQILQQLNHPAIPKYRNSFETEIDGVNSFVLVQDYIPARSLQEIVESSQVFSETDTIAIAQQLLTTLSYLHQQLPPVIHRDIKPSNILLSVRPNGTPRQVSLVDFGAVQVSASKHSGTMTIVGSYGYMPLEQFSGQTTPASDLYSLGMTLMYLLTGIHPAEMPQENGQVHIAALMAQQPISDYFCHWLTQLTHPYTDERLDSAAIALTLLNAADGTHGYYPHLRPPLTALNICRNYHEITVTTPFEVHNSSYSAGCLLPLLSLGILVLVCTVGYGIFVLLFIVGKLGIIIGMMSMIAWVTWANRPSQRYLNKYNVLSIHRQQGIRMGVARGVDPSKLSRVIWQSRTSAFSAINLVTYTPGHTFKQYSLGNRAYSHYRKYDREKNLSTKNGIVRLPPQLSIHAGKHKYTLHQHLTLAQQLWLDQELSDFLGLSLQTLNPTDEAQHNRLKKINS